MTQFNDFVSIDEEANASEPKGLVFPPNAIELPLHATERLMVDIGSYDKYSKGISNVSVHFRGSDGAVLLSSDENNPVVHDADGLYSFEVDGSLINRGTYSALWSWTLQKNVKQYNRTASTFYYSYFESPTYYKLSEQEKLIVRSVMARFADLYDNTLGQSKFSFYENYQSTYGVERVAEMMRFACNAINAEMTPATRYVVGPGGRKFPEKWYAVLEVATYVELLRHAVRSYVEQPAIAGGTDVPYADRRDYLQRWASILEETKAGLNAQIAAMRRDHLNLGGMSSLVSGGIYGNLYLGSAYAMEQGRMRSAYTPAIIIR